MPVGIPEFAVFYSRYVSNFILEADLEMLSGKIEIEPICPYLNVGIISVIFMKNDTKCFF